MCASVSFFLWITLTRPYIKAHERWRGRGAVSNTSHIIGNYGKINTFFSCHTWCKRRRLINHNALCKLYYQCINTAHYHKCVIFVADLILDGHLGNLGCWCFFINVDNKVNFTVCHKKRDANVILAKDIIQVTVMISDQASAICLIWPHAYTNKSMLNKCSSHISC